VTGSESRAFSQWARAFAEQNRLAFRAGAIENVMEVFNASFPLITFATLFYAVLWLAEQAVTAGKTPLSPGHFVAFSAALGGFLMQTLSTGLTAMQALAIVPLYERARPILEALPEVDTTKVDPGELAGEIEVSRVTFRYHEDGPIVLSDISLRIEPGEFVAIVGPSGSGKSTPAAPGRPRSRSSTGSPPASIVSCSTWPSWITSAASGCACCCWPPRR